MIGFLEVRLAWQLPPQFALLYTIRIHLNSACHPKTPPSTPATLLNLSNPPSYIYSLDPPAHLPAISLSILGYTSSFPQTILTTQHHYTQEHASTSSHNSQVSEPEPHIEVVLISYHVASPRSSTTPPSQDGELSRFVKGFATPSGLLSLRHHGSR